MEERPKIIERVETMDAETTRRLCGFYCNTLLIRWIVKDARRNAKSRRLGGVC